MKVNKLMVGVIAVVIAGIGVSLIVFAQPPACADSGSCGECTTSGGTKGFWAYDYGRKQNRCVQCDGRV